MGTIIENNIIIWLDSDPNHTNENTKSLFEKIQKIINSIETFYNMDECMNYLRTIKYARIFMIITQSFYEQHINDTNPIKETSLNISVHVFCNDSSKQKSWENEFRNFKGTFTDIRSMVDTIEKTICRSNGNQFVNSIVSTVNNDFDELDPTYIYSKILIENIFNIDYDDKSIEESFEFCRRYNADNSATLKAINEFAKDYKKRSPIWWYTKESNVYRQLSDAVRNNDVDIIIKMGFFLKDLHRQIKSIYSTIDQTVKIFVYRGQGMSVDDFHKLSRQKGELFSFNWFLSTSTDQEVAMTYANTATLDDTTVGILFEMEIDPIICSIPFAYLNNESYYSETESEVLISMNSVFRIGEMNQLGHRLWIVCLTATCAMHEGSKFLKYHIKNEIYSVSSWDSLAILLHKMGKYDKAVDIFNKAMEVTDDRDSEKFTLSISSNYNNIGLICDSTEQYSDALIWYQEALEILKNHHSPNQRALATIYNNIGSVCRSLGDYTKALSNCEEALKIRLKSSSENDTSLVNIYSNIGLIYESIGNYSNALSYYEKVYEIQKSSLSLNHPYFTLSFNNFAGIYSLMGDYSNALFYYTKTVEIQEKYLPSNHPSLSLTYSNIGYVYQLMGKYSMAHSYYEEALKIQQQIYPSKSLAIATTYNNIGVVHRFMGNYSVALSYFDKTLTIEEACLVSDHPLLASTYNNLGTAYQYMKKYSTSVEYYEKALKIWQKCLPSNHASLATIHNNIGSLYDSMGDYKQAFAYYEKVVEIQQTSSSTNHIDLASTYNNMGEACRMMEDYPNALSYYQKALEIEEKQLSNIHPSLAITLSNMAVAFEAHNQYERAFEYAKRAFDIIFSAFGASHSDTIVYQKYRDHLRQKLLTVK